MRLLKLALAMTTTNYEYPPAAQTLAYICCIVSFACLAIQPKLQTSIYSTLVYYFPFEGLCHYEEEIYCDPYDSNQRMYPRRAWVCVFVGVLSYLQYAGIPTDRRLHRAR